MPDGEGRHGLGNRVEGSPQAGLQTSRGSVFFFRTLLRIFQMSLFCTLEGMGLEKIAISLRHWQQLCCMTLALHGFKRCGGRGRRRLWAHDRGLFKHGFFDQNLVGSFNSRKFKGRMRMDVSTLSTYVVILHRNCKDAIRTCA